MEFSIIIPCLNEAETLAVCIKKAQYSIQRLAIQGEIIIADNGSTDGSQEIALQYGAKLVLVSERGYGAAIQGGIDAAQGKYIIVGDADDSYDFSNLEPFVSKLREGADLVMGNRFQGGIKPGAMPFLHRYLGNPVLTFIGKLFFKSPCGDFHCGLRGFRKDAIKQLNLKTPGMEFASEMIVKATLANLKICEVPTILSPDGRSRPSHLRSWRDGWRHLRFLLLYAPRWLFLFPGLFLLFFGLLGILILARAPLVILGVTFDIHSLHLFSLISFVGFQLVLFGIIARTYAESVGLLPEKLNLTTAFQKFSIEYGVIAGLIITLLGLVAVGYSVYLWMIQDLGNLNPREIMRIIIPASLLISIGVETIFASFLLGIFKLKSQP